jgi:20S proteasome subunit beta 4
MDYMGAVQKVDKAAHGYAGNLLYGLMDSHWRPNLELDDAMKIIQACCDEMRRRFIIAQPKFQVKCVDASGIRILEVN